jgi:hypothetical protein
MNHAPSAPGPTVDLVIEQPSLKLRMLTSICDTASCPTIYESDRGTLVVQGYAVPAGDAGVALPDGELLVEIPVNLLTAAARAVS